MLAPPGAQVGHVNGDELGHVAGEVMVTVDHPPAPDDGHVGGGVTGQVGVSVMVAVEQAVIGPTHEPVVNIEVEVTVLASQVLYSGHDEPEVTVRVIGAQVPPPPPGVVVGPVVTGETGVDSLVKEDTQL